MNDHEDMGGEWTAEWRHLHLESTGWLDGRDVKLPLGQVRTAALRADKDLTKPNLYLLQQAVQNLEKALVNHQARILRLQKEVGWLVAAVVQTRALNPDLPNTSRVERERQATEELLDESELGLDRVARFYGLGKPKR